MFEELELSSKTSAAGFLPAVKQIGNVASLPAIVKNSIGLPDVHSVKNLHKLFLKIFILRVMDLLLEILLHLMFQILMLLSRLVYF